MPLEDLALDLREQTEGWLYRCKPNASLDQADYPQAKRAFLMFTLAMARRWAADGIQVRAFHPKMVVPANQVPSWILKLLRATVFQSTQAF